MSAVEKNESAVIASDAKLLQSLDTYSKESGDSGQ